MPSLKQFCNNAKTSESKNNIRKKKCLLIMITCVLALILLTNHFVIERERKNGKQVRHINHDFEKPQWTWLCNNGRCEQYHVNNTKIRQSLTTCNMLCSCPQLWPKPTGYVNLSTNAIPVNIEDFKLKIFASPNKNITLYLTEAFMVFKQDMQFMVKQIRRYQENKPKVEDIIVQISVNGSGDPRLLVKTDESYLLSIQSIQKSTQQKTVINISAYSFCGARHALETLSQLIWFDTFKNSLLMIKAGTVEDAPIFKYRGLLLDTARHFIPVKDIIRTIDAMAATKLNTFHWHATDSQSFPLQLNNLPQMAKYGAYDERSVYTTEDVKTIVHRARLRGIRIIIEIDAPAHVGNAWSWGPGAGFGNLANCLEIESWIGFCREPPCGQLNPLNQNVYCILTKIYEEIIQLTGVDDVFHLGGDEVEENCWRLTSVDPMVFWLEFTNRAINALKRANGDILPELTLIWSSPLLKLPFRNGLHQNLSFQIWNNELNLIKDSQDVLNAGRRAVLSHVNAWYLDCGYTSWLTSRGGSCAYNSWQHMYNYRPWMSKYLWNIEGGEACQWTEQLDPGGLDASVWPRAAAMAERLWSDRADGVTPDVYLRLDTHVSRLIERGIEAQPLWPHWCTQNPYACLHKY